MCGMKTTPDMPLKFLQLELSKSDLSESELSESSGRLMTYQNNAGHFLKQDIKLQNIHQFNFSVKLTVKNYYSSNEAWNYVV